MMLAVSRSRLSVPYGANLLYLVLLSVRGAWSRILYKQHDRCCVQWTEERWHAVNVVTLQVHWAVYSAMFGWCMNRKHTSVIYVGWHWQAAVSFGHTERLPTVLQCSTFVSPVNSHMPRKSTLQSCVFRSTLRQSRPNKAGLKFPSVCLSIKCFFDFSEIWRVGRGWWVMHDGMQYDPIQGQDH